MTESGPVTRHRAPGGADRDPVTRGASTVVSWLLGPGLLWAGRLLLASWVVLALAVTATRDAWSTAPLDEGGLPEHPLVSVFFVVCVLTGLLLPVLLGPAGPVALARAAGGVLTLPTVLGRRRVDLRTLRVRSVRLWVGRGNPWWHLLGDGHGGHVLLLHSLRGGVPVELRDAVEDLAVEGRLPPAALLDLGWGVPRADRVRVTVVGGACGALLGLVAFAAITLLALPLLPGTV
ncbi:MAG TPA: hypothetical protein VGC57_06500 [Cellulomonas sp.]